ncbi:hypothetical protein STVIR_3881 [Streptomyces viridochromogenes Tue57]|uniref:Uncharacterized protein n=1 Tax=Streptomyces viridochromogenes Tue57 TaxID=1160705 RepID=L8PFL9_STRVR|nr:hypothetical protein STVIR_3881 [Streptomyces viridochromogenes Tue57]
MRQGRCRSLFGACEHGVAGCHAGALQGLTRARACLCAGGVR